jgi:hypothetical protein
MRSFVTVAVLLGWSACGGGGGEVPSGNTRPWNGKTFPAPSPKLESLAKTPPSEAEVRALLAQANERMKSVLGSDAAALDTEVSGASVQVFAAQGLAEWIHGRPRAALYFFGKAAVLEPTRLLTLHNYAALLTLHGYPHVAVPLLRYVNQQQPGDAAVLGNLAVAHYDLGAPADALAFADEALRKDPRHFAANKVKALALLQLAAGEPDAPTRALAAQAARESLAAHADAELKTLLDAQQLGGDPLGSYFDTDDGREFALLETVQIIPVPTVLEESGTYRAANLREQDALRATANAIDAKKQRVLASKPAHVPQVVTGTANKALIAKADAIVNWAAQRRLQLEQPIKDEAQRALAAIRARYDAAADGRTDCASTNAQNRQYLAEAAVVINDAVARRAKVARDFARDRAAWFPMLMRGPYGDDGEWFLAIESLYVGDITSLYVWALDSMQPYQQVCENQPPPQSGPIKEWEDAFCATFKLQLGVGPAKVKMNCNEFEVEGGEGYVGSAKLTVDGDGRFKELTLAGGLGAEWHLGSAAVISVDAEASVKPFVTLGFDGDTVGVSDVGVTGELSATASASNALVPVPLVEVTVVEASAALNAGVSGGGALPDALGFGL